MIDSNIVFVLMFNIWPTLTKCRSNCLKVLHSNFHFHAISVDYIKALWFIYTINMYQVIIFWQREAIMLIPHAIFWSNFKFNGNCYRHNRKIQPKYHFVHIIDNTNTIHTRTRWRRVKTLGWHQVGVNLQSHAQHQLWISTWHIFHEFHKIMPV